MKQSCQLFFRTDGVYVFSESRTVTGLWIVNGIGEVLSAPSPEELTRAVKEALAKSEDSVPLPAELSAVPAWVRQRKLKSWKAIEKDAIAIGVQILDADLVLTHFKAEKGGGFLGGDEETFSAAQLDQIGNRLLQRRSGGSAIEPRPRPPGHANEPKDEAPGLPKMPGTGFFAVGDHAVHVFRGACEVVAVGSMKGVIPSVTIRFPNGDLQTLALPCPILLRHP